MGVTSVKMKKAAEKQDFSYLSDEKKSEIHQIYKILEIPYTTPSNYNYQEFTLLKSDGIEFSTSSSSVNA